MNFYDWLLNSNIISNCDILKLNQSLSMFTKKL